MKIKIRLKSLLKQLVNKNISDKFKLIIKNLILIKLKFT